MSTQTDTHEAEVRRIAEVLAQVEFPGWAMAKLDTNNACRTAWQISIDKNMDKARAMVAEMAKVAKEAHNAGWSHRSICKYPTDNSVDYYANEILVQSGLIPSPTKTGEK
jgi:hypothetical protein